MCNLVASWSEDTSRKVGAVIVGNANEIRSTGFNGLPRRVNSKIEARHSREKREKYLWFEHAERNALYNATRSGISSEDCRIYISNFPCADCARGIIQSGIIEVNTFYFDEMDESFASHYSASLTMLQEAEIKIRIFERNDSMISDIYSDFIALSESLVGSNI